MELKILKERETPLLSRKRYTIEITEEGATPSRKQIRDMVALKLKADPELTIVKHIYPRYGLEKSRCIVNIYENAEDMKRYEDEGLLKKHAKEEKPAEKEDTSASESAPDQKKEGSDDKPAEAPAEQKTAEAAE